MAVALAFYISLLLVQAAVTCQYIVNAYAF